MSEIKLYDALDCSPNEEFRCSDMMDVEREEVRINEELDLIVSCNKKTMKGVATLVLVVNKMIKSPFQHGRKPSDDELFSFIIQDQVAEETTDGRNWTASMEQRKVIYERVNSLKQCTLTDLSKKNFILHSISDEQQFKLQAIILKAGYSDLKVNFDMVRYSPKLNATTVDSSCVRLSIRDENIHLSCSWEDERATLNLEKCSDESLQNIYQDTDMDRFLFIKNTTGYNLTTFESVKYRGWYISTSSDDMDHSVDMCKVDSSYRGQNCIFNVSRT